MDGYTTFLKKYELYIDGNDLDAKAAQKLKPGDSLTIQRMDDELDTFEMVILTPRGKELDMLSYEESIGIAPFLDDGNLKITSCTVDNVQVKKGASRAKDQTVLTFKVEYSYMVEMLKPVEIEDTLAFIPSYDMVLAMAIYHCLHGHGTFEKVYLNCYELDCPVYDTAFIDEDEDLAGQTYNFACTVLFNPEFTKCKIVTRLYNEDIEYGINLPEEMQDSVLILVNHMRIFEDLDPLVCDVEE